MYYKLIYHVIFGTKYGIYYILTMGNVTTLTLKGCHTVLNVFIVYSIYQCL